jgi:DNA-directed RNA polymerase subunit K/omega
MSDTEVAPESQTEAAVRHEGRPIESRFLYVDVAAARAKQLRKGAKVRLDAAAPRAVKPERLAMEEVNQQLVEWDLPDFTALAEKR